jgi:hypothetical protein
MYWHLPVFQSTQVPLTKYFPSYLPNKAKVAVLEKKTLHANDFINSCGKPLLKEKSMSYTEKQNPLLKNTNSLTLKEKGDWSDQISD